MACRRECQKYRAINSNSTHTRYAIGQKRCGTCELFLTWNHDNYCPCCGHRLRVKPKNARLKRQFNDLSRLKELYQKLERLGDQLTLQMYVIQ
jgi:hypothetical protein